MKKIIDQLGNEFVFENIPKRVISLVPSQTELLFDLGLEQKIIGRTKFCIHPKPLINQVQRVGGTKNLNIELIKNLQPDLIIANKEENVKSQIDELALICKVWISNVETIENSFSMMQSFGEIFDVKSKTNELIESIKKDFKHLIALKSFPAIYLIWNEPMMTIGGDTFINEMMQNAGFTNVFSNQNRYPVINDEAINASNAEYILLSSEPFPFKEKNLNEFRQKFPDKKILLVDGEMFSWYGSRMKLATKYFQQLRKEIA